MVKELDCGKWSTSMAALGSRPWGKCLLLVALAAVTMGAKKKTLDPPTTVALIDMKRVFDQSPEFRRRVANLKEAVEQAEASIREKQEEIRELQRQLAEESMLRADRERIEVQARDATQALSVEVTLSKKVFTEREAALYLTTYREVQAEIRDYMSEHGIAIVFKFRDHEELDSPDEIMKALNAAVVAYHTHVDITDAIIARLEERFVGEAAPVEAP